MKTTLAAMTALALVGASSQTTSAGHSGWATAGAVLSGVVAGAVIARSFEPAPVYYTAPVTYVPAATVVYAPPPPVLVQPAPVVVYQQPVYAVPAPVYVAPPPVVVAPRPYFGVHVGFGPGRCAPVYRRCP